ncbi:MAG: serine hydrolase [candidate division WOR-3 bacterium]|nr:MAG: serine hydrolase [candidate division WOR-3 bacterium]
MKRKLLVLLISAFWVILSIFNQSCKAEDKAKRIDELMTYCYDADMFNGTVLVAHDGEVVYKNAFGYANFDNMETLKVNSAFCIGSIGKQFTGMAVMILKERNELDYEDKLSDYFPEFPDYADKITIRHLLNHTSGIPNWMNFSVFRARPGDFKDDITNKDIFDFLIQQESLDFEPGTKYSYSNSGYVLLAMIVEKVSGEPFYKFMEDNIFGPLDMKNTLVWNDTKPEIPDKTIGYSQFGEKDDYNILTSGAGSIYSTIEDLYKWDQGLYTEKLVSQETLKEAFTPGLLNDGTPSRTLGDSTWGYGFGWLLRKNNLENIVWHDGGFNGFNAIFYRELNKREVIIFLTNKGTPWQLYPVHDAVKSILRGESYKFPRIPIGIKMKNLIDENGVIESINKYHELRKTHVGKYDFSEDHLNSLGYYYLNNQRFIEAKVVLKLNVEMYPNSSNAYDSYGEACMLNGDYDEAIKNYKRSLELNPDNTNAVEMFKKINKKMMTIEK